SRARARAHASIDVAERSTGAPIAASQTKKQTAPVERHGDRGTRGAANTGSGTRSPLCTRKECTLGVRSCAAQPHRLAGRIAPLNLERIAFEQLIVPCREKAVVAVAIGDAERGRAHILEHALATHD